MIDTGMGHCRQDKCYCTLVDAIESLLKLDRNDDESVPLKHTYMIRQIDHFTTKVAKFSIQFNYNYN